jgi:hypothetical protein
MLILVVTKTPPTKQRSSSMSRIETAALDTATGETAEVYARIKTLAGGAPNTFGAIGAHGPAVH